MYGGLEGGGLWRCQVCRCSAMQLRGRTASIMHAANGHANAAQGGSGGQCMGANTHSEVQSWGAAEESFCSAAVLDRDLHMLGK